MLIPTSTPYFESKNFTLYNGDCKEIMKSMSENSIDMIFADPPYFLSKSKEDMSFKGDWDLSKGVKLDTQFQYDWIKEARRILKPEGTIWITGTHHNIYQCGYSLQLLGFKILNEIAWFKPKNNPFSRNFFNFAHETIIWAKKDEKSKHYLNPKVLDFKYRDKLNKEGKHMNDVWDILPCSKYEIDWHPTPKPIELLERIILSSTKPDAVILDPFNGSGTTGIATLNLGYGRSFIGIDLDSHYLDLTIKRMEESLNTGYNKEYKGQVQRSAKSTIRENS